VLDEPDLYRDYDLIIVVKHSAEFSFGNEMVEVRDHFGRKKAIPESKNDEQAESTHPAGGPVQKERCQAKASFHEENNPRTA
jgi:hypothetical protein